MKVCWREPLGVLVRREQVQQLVAEHRDAARLEADDRHARLDLGAQRVERSARSSCLAVVEHAEVVERPAAAERPARDDRPGSRRPPAPRPPPSPSAGWKWLLNVSGQRITRGRPAFRRGRAREPRLERLGGERAASSRCGRDPAEPLGRAADSPGVCVTKFAEPRRMRRQPRPPVDQAHRVGVARPEPALVVVREELGLVGRHVDVHRALALAALAGQAQVERLLDLLARSSRRSIASPCSISNSRRARPRVECFSSRVTM